MPTTTFESKALILGQVWMQHKTDDEMSDFFEYNDIGVPLAFAYAEGIVNSTPTLEQYVNESFDLFLEALNIEDAGFDDLQDLWDALEALEENKDSNPWWGPATLFVTNHKTLFPKDITNQTIISPNQDITNLQNFPPAELIP